ncbi:MAG TPA: hypothetical protein VGV13_14305 [Methylomirabilota bacterium]|jgi:hypothetical protein|nr:hypothetical protein [Methylomirabilota bacterium]
MDRQEIAAAIMAIMESANPECPYCDMPICLAVAEIGEHLCNCLGWAARALEAYEGQVERLERHLGLRP